jgi:hypothetical protein
LRENWLWAWPTGNSMIATRHVDHGSAGRLRP